MYNDLILRMMEFDRGMPHLIQHFLKVHAFARLIGSKEGLDNKTLHILETAAIVHDKFHRLLELILTLI